MFTQLFGSYLLNNNLVSRDQLTDALEYQNTVRLKLGVMAVNSGFMTAEQVNKVHDMQATVDKKFGEIAIDMGFLNNGKLEILLSTQKSGHLLLGQAMVDKNYMSLEQFEKALNSYKNEHSLSDEQFNSLQNEDLDEIINIFYNFNLSSDEYFYKEYLFLLIRNIVRFVDTDFKILEITSIREFKFEWMASQEIKGVKQLNTFLEAEEYNFIKFAGKYAKEEYSNNDDYTKAAVGEFLNQVNGLFLVNMSNNNLELELNPQEIFSKGDLTELSEAYCISIDFSFGVVKFIISKEKPVILK